jgi:hypothetical protein
MSLAHIEISASVHVIDNDGLAEYISLYQFTFVVNNQLIIISGFRHCT